MDFIKLLVKKMSSTLTQLMTTSYSPKTTNLPTKKATSTS